MVKTTTYCVTSLGNDFLTELGKMIVQFSILEFNLKQLISIMIARQSYGNSIEILLSEFSMMQLIKVAKSLLSERKMHEENKKLFNRIKSINEHRNKIIHSMIGVDGVNKSLVRVKSKNQNGKLDKQYEKISTSVISKLQQEILSIGIDLNRLMVKVYELDNKKNRY